MRLRLRSGKITHRFNVNAKEFVPFVNEVKKEETTPVKRFEERFEEYVYLNTLTGQLVYMMATSKNLPNYLQPYEM